MQAHARTKYNRFFSIGTQKCVPSYKFLLQLQKTSFFYGILKREIYSLIHYIYKDTGFRSVFNDFLPKILQYNILLFSGGSRNLLSGRPNFWEGRENFFLVAQIFGRDKKITFWSPKFLGGSRNLLSGRSNFREGREIYFLVGQIFGRSKKIFFWRLLFPEERRKVTLLSVILSNITKNIFASGVMPKKQEYYHYARINQTKILK
jgi:hypothetical protein